MGQYQFSERKENFIKQKILGNRTVYAIPHYGYIKLIRTKCDIIYKII
jgi:hypothetical protein